MPLSEPLQQVGRTLVRYRGRTLIYFGGCDYFRLSSHPKVLEALRKGAGKFGLNVAASRSTTGNHTLFGKLESELARFFSVPGAALLSNGYATNLAFTQTFTGHFSHALIDDRSHGSLQDSTAFLRCSVIPFRHRNPEDLQRRLGRCDRSARPLVMTDGMFAHDGSIAPLDSYLSMMPRQGTLLVDDAHGAGTLGASGKGTPEACGVTDKRIVQTISLSKAFGVYGGAVLGASAVIDGIKERSRVFNGNTPLPLPLANAALAAVRIVKRDRSIRNRLQANADYIRATLRASNPKGVASAAEVPLRLSSKPAARALRREASPLISFTPRDKVHASRISKCLLDAGIFPTLIHYAGGPGSGYFRFAISSEHTAEQLDRLAEALIASR